jgi:phage recombination protein Bet
MSKEIANITPGVLATYSPEQLQLITDTVAKNATPLELKLFLHRCNILELDPLKPGQIHFIKYGTSPGTVVVGIEGFRSKAARTGHHVSTTRGVTRDGANIICGWAKVKRRDLHGEVQEYYEESPMSEYFNDKNPSWRKMPETMIKKVAEAACLRMAYPDDLGGVYIQEEEPIIAKLSEKQPHFMDGIKEEADLEAARMAEDAPKDGIYRVPFGSFKGRSIPECIKVFGVVKVENAINLCEEKIKSNVPYTGVTFDDMKVFIARATVGIAEFEKQNPMPE